MKKSISLALALALVTSMVVPIFASGNSKDATVSYNPGMSYSVSIPESVVISPETNKGVAEVSATEISLASGYSLEMTVSSNDYADTNSWELVDKSNSSNTLTYIIGTSEGVNDIVNNSVILTADDTDTEVTETLYFTLQDTNAKPANYEDTLTFTVNAVNN